MNTVTAQKQAWEIVNEVKAAFDNTAQKKSLIAVMVDTAIEAKVAPVEIIEGMKKCINDNFDLMARLIGHPLTKEINDFQIC